MEKRKLQLSFSGLIVSPGRYIYICQPNHSDSHPDLVSASPVEGAGEIVASPQRNYSNRGAPTLRPGDGVQDREDPAHSAVTPAH